MDLEIHKFPNELWVLLCNKLALGDGFDVSPGPSKSGPWPGGTELRQQLIIAASAENGTSTLAVEAFEDNACGHAGTAGALGDFGTGAKTFDFGKPLTPMGLWRGRVHAPTAHQPQVEGTRSCHHLTCTTRMKKYACKPCMHGLP